MQGVHGLAVILVGAEADGHRDLAAVRHHIGAGAAVDDTAVVGDMGGVGEGVNGHDLPGGLQYGAGALFRGGARVAGDALHPQGQDAASFAGGDDLPVGSPLSTVKAAPQPMACRCKKSTVCRWERVWAVSSSLSSTRRS